MPGVGHFGHCLSEISKAGYDDALRDYIKAGKPFLGICVGLQALFEGSEENLAVPGLGIIPGQLKRFSDADKAVPHIGWNSARPVTTDSSKSYYGLNPNSKYYYVHSYAVPYRPGQLEKQGWTIATAKYGSEDFIGAIWRDNVVATQFHPEKSGQAGLQVINAFLRGEITSTISHPLPVSQTLDTGLTHRIIACLDVRANDDGDLVVTKGDQYDVREKQPSLTNGTTAPAAGGQVRNLGKPVSVASKYYAQGADEITFLNITSFRSLPLRDLPMLAVLREASKHIFIPLTVGGGIKDTLDPETNTVVPAAQIAALYFRSGADKVSIGGDAVLAAEQYHANGGRPTGETSIETISAAYGNQAVVISVDPKRIPVTHPSATTHHTIPTAHPGPNGETHVWYQCTIHGGRTPVDIDVIQLVTACEALGAGEILLNAIDRDGTKSGFDLELIDHVKAAVRIPVIASSGAGHPGHFAEVFERTGADAALGAGIFHRGEFTVGQVKAEVAGSGLLVRPVEDAE